MRKNEDRKTDVNFRLYNSKKKKSSKMKERPKKEEMIQSMKNLPTISIRKKEVEMIGQADVKAKKKVN